MNEILLYAAIIGGLLFLSLFIPGVEFFAKGLFSLIGRMLTAIFAHKGQFVVWTLKTLIADHGKVLKHMITSKEELDPTFVVRKQAGAAGSDD